MPQRSPFPDPAWRPESGPAGKAQGQNLIFFSAPPPDFGPVKAALSTLRRDQEIPQGSLAWRLFGWGNGPEFEAITAFLSADALHWATWSPATGVQARTLPFSAVKEIRVEVLDEYERLMREQPTRITEKHFQARVHSFGLIWTGVDGTCLLGHHLVLERAPTGLKPFLEAAMETWTAHLKAQVPRRMAEQGFIQVGLDHHGWIRLFDTHLELKADQGPVHRVPYRRIRAMRLWEQSKWILELDEHPPEAPFFGKPYQTDLVRVANLAFLMECLAPKIDARRRARQGQRSKRPGRKPQLQPKPLPSVPAARVEPELIDGRQLSEAQRNALLGAFRDGTVLVQDEKLSSGCSGLIALVLAPLALLFLASLGYGESVDTLLHAPWAVALYALPLAGFCFGALALLRDSPRFRRSSLPEGSFLTAAHFLRIRKGQIQAFPLEQASAFTRVYLHERRRLEDVRLDISFGPSTHSIPLGPPDQAVERWERLELARARYQTARHQGNSAALKELDPLDGLPRSSGPLPPPTSELPLWLRPAVLRAPVWALAFLLAWPCLQVRNHWSDDKAYRRALEEGSVKALVAYSGRGRDHLTEVREARIPQAALREALQADFDKAGALRRVAQTYPAVRPQALQELRAALLRQRALWRSGDGTADPRWRAEFEALFNQLLQQENPSLALRFRLLPPRGFSAKGGELLDPAHPQSELWKESAFKAIRSPLERVLGGGLVDLRNEGWQTQAQSTDPRWNPPRPPEPELPTLHIDMALDAQAQAAFRVSLHLPGRPPHAFIWAAPLDGQTLGNRADRESMRSLVGQSLREIGLGGAPPSREPKDPWLLYRVENALSALGEELDRRWR